MLGLLSAVVLALVATFQAAGGCPPTDWQSLAQDPVVAAAFDQAWNDSLEGTPGEHEEGGWIYRCQGVNLDDLSEWVTVIDHWRPDSVDSIVPSALSKDPNCELAGSFHTHPGPALGAPGDDGYANEIPSVEDVTVAEADGVPGFVIYGEGPSPDGTTIVPYGPPEAKAPCTPNPDYGPGHYGSEPGDGSGDGSGDESGDGSGDEGGGSGSGSPGSGAPDGAPGGQGGPGTGESTGDPHLVTFDGRHVEFQASGEYVLAQSLDGDFEIQTRQQAPHASSHVTVNTAVAVRLDGSIVEASADHVIVDGEEVDVGPDETITTPGGGRFSARYGEFTFVWADGTEARFMGRSVIVRLSDAQAEDVEGLLGDYDGDPNDDLVDAEGVSLLGDGRLTFDATYEQLAPAWQVNDETSLFTYDEGQSTETFALDDIPGFGLYVDLLPDDRRDEAEEVCRAAGVTDPVRLHDCSLDVGATEDDSFAEEAAAVEATLIEWQDDRRPTPPLVEAAVRGDAAEVSRLLSEGADPNEPDSFDRTALHWATFASRPEIVADLLAAGADPDRVDDNGETALHIAATFGMTAVVEELLDVGADTAVENENGQTALTIAEQQGHDELVELLS